MISWEKRDGLVFLQKDFKLDQRQGGRGAINYDDDNVDDDDKDNDDDADFDDDNNDFDVFS